MTEEIAGAIYDLLKQRFANTTSVVTHQLRNGSRAIFCFHKRSSTIYCNDTGCLVEWYGGSTRHQLELDYNDPEFIDELMKVVMSGVKL